MSGPLGSSQWMYASGGYEIDQSLRFDKDRGTYLSWTPAAAGNRKTFTVSAWVKTSLKSTEGVKLLRAYGGNDDNWTAIGSLDSSGDLWATYDRVGNSNSGRVQVTGKFRDPSSWYHIVIAVDTTQGTAANRVKTYINGEQTSHSYTDYPSQNFDYSFLNNTYEHRIFYKVEVSSNEAGDGYLAEMNFIDGQALTPADFGETGDYGEWKPIEYEGTYGTNGFYLNFAGGGGVMSATGGNSTTTDGDYKAASFTSNGTFTPSANGYVEYLVIAGGGGGGSNSGGDEGGGGGGAGGYRTGYLPVNASTAYSITVGDGGLGRANGAGAGGDGGNSVFSTITSIGGGGGSATDTDTARSGGSGGGMGSNNSYTAGAGTSGQGNAGGGGHGWHGGGGGGAGQVGGNYNPPSSSNGDGGNGGNGLASSITGSSVTRAGGGGGGTWNSASYTGQSPGTGGSGGGGAGGATNQGAGSAGTANTGGGGGGAGNNLASGAGGSGIVIIRYKFQ